jgi:hypothetical protein
VTVASWRPPTEKFVVKHYVSAVDELPCLKGNGFDGLTLGETREEAEEFVAWLNLLLELYWRYEADRG